MQNTQDMHDIQRENELPGIPRVQRHADGANSLDHGSLTFIGTATVLLRYAGFTILTDPNFLHRGDHVHLGYGLASQRLTDPALELDDLPPLDVVTLSHLHEDHFDRVVAERLNKDVPIVAPRQAARALAGKGFRQLYGLPTWGACTFAKGGRRVRITAMPGRHAPLPLAPLFPPVMGSMLDFSDESGARRMRVYITGDTLHVPELSEIPLRYPGIDLMLLHLGGTRIAGLLLTMDAEQGIRTVRLIAPRHTIPVHYDDYDVFQSPLTDFAKAVAAARLGDRVTFLEHGDTYAFTAPGADRARAG